MKKIILFIMAAVLLTVMVSGCSAEKKEIAKASDIWYENSDVIVHALGTVAGRTVTNSKEAFLQSYADGFRVMEADFSVTSDGILVVRHGFDENSYYIAEQTDVGIMDYETFMNTPIRGLYTPLDAAQLFKLMKDHPDVYLVTDTKGTTEKEIKEAFSLLVQEVEAAKDSTLYDRIIVQIYNEDMLDTVKAIYPFDDFIFTVYQLENVDYDSVGAFCEENNIPVVTVPSEYYTKEVGEILHSYGLKIYIHTLNRAPDIKWYCKIGADGIYSDYVKQSEYEQIIKDVEKPA